MLWDDFEYDFTEEELAEELELMVEEGYLGCYDNEETGETIYYVLEERH